MKVKGVLIDVFNRKVEKAEIDAELNTYYEKLNCDIIDITSRKINGKYYDIICDDIGLLKDNNIVSAVDGYGRPVLVGNLFICLHDGKGNEKSLNEKQFESVLSRVMVYFRNGKKIPVIVLD